MNIVEDYCSYEVAKLLKEKGFDEPCLQMWECGPTERYLFRLQNSCYQNITEEDSCLAPTHQMAMKWLREEHNIFIEVSVSIDLNGKHHFMYMILDKICKCVMNSKHKYTYEEAVETALKYCLENLI